jgi:hypothetical protein
MFVWNVSGACPARVWRILGLACLFSRLAHVGLSCVWRVSGACLEGVLRVSAACVWCVSGACLARVCIVSGARLVRVCILCVWRVSGACLERVWRVGRARRACGAYKVRRERECCVSGMCLVRFLLVSGRSLV